MDELETLKNKLEDLQGQLKAKQEEQSNFDIDPYDYEDDYCNSLDEVYGEFMGMPASRILRECDEIQYRCGLHDYCDNLDIEDTAEWRVIQSEIEDLEFEIESVESEIEDLESEE